MKMVSEIFTCKYERIILFTFANHFIIKDVSSSQKHHKLNKKNESEISYY